MIRSLNTSVNSEMRKALVAEYRKHDSALRNRTGVAAIFLGMEVFGSLNAEGVMAVGAAVVSFKFSLSMRRALRERAAARTQLQAHDALHQSTTEQRTGEISQY